MSAQSENKLRPSELRAHSDQELSSLIGTLSEELFKYRMQRYTNQLENTMQIRKLRRDLARVKTILSARQLGLEVRQEGGAAPEGEAAEKTAQPRRVTKASKAKAKAAKAAKTKKAAPKAEKAPAKAEKAKPDKGKSRPPKKTKAKSAEAQE